MEFVHIYRVYTRRIIYLKHTFSTIFIIVYVLRRHGWLILGPQKIYVLYRISLHVSRKHESVYIHRVCIMMNMSHCWRIPKNIWYSIRSLLDITILELCNDYKTFGVVVFYIWIKIWYINHSSFLPICFE